MRNLLRASALAWVFLGVFARPVLAQVANHQPSASAHQIFSGLDFRTVSSVPAAPHWPGLLGWYADVGGGVAWLQAAQSRCDDVLDAAEVFSGVSCSINSTVADFRAGGGITIGRHVDVGVNYVRLGQTREHIEINLAPVGIVTDDLVGSVTGIDIVGRLYFWCLYAEGGVWRWDAKTTITGEVNLDIPVEIPAVGPLTSHDHGWSPFAGAGVQFPVGRHAAIRAGYEHRWVNNSGTHTSIDEQYDIISAHFVISSRK
jgi:hypothetical protein